MRNSIVLLLVAATVAAQPLSRARSQRLAATARALARKGQGQALECLLEVMRDLGQPAEEQARLARSARGILARARKRAPAQAEARGLEALARELEGELPALPEGERERTARAVLRLDGDRDGARSTLGYVRRGDGWVRAEFLPLLERRAEIEDAVRRARRLEVRIETGPSDSPTLEGLYGAGGSVAWCGGVRAHASDVSRERLARILRQALRACALSQYLRGGELALPQARRLEVVWLRRHADYARSIDLAALSGVMNAEQVAWARPLTGYKDPRGWYVFVPEMEAACQARLFYYLFGGGVQACLEAGHVNWVCLAFFGIPMHSVAWVETKEQRVPSTRTGEHDAVERERMLRLGRAGLAGTRSWMAWLAARGEDPRWSDSFVDAVGKIAGNDLLKCTLVNEYLQEAGLLQRSMEETGKEDRGRPEAIGSALAKCLGEDLSAFERRWKRWLLPLEQGLVQRLRAGGAGSGEERALLTRLDAIREQALRAEDRHALELDPDLTSGARAHARYLARYPEQQTRWPDAHEQYADRDGFSVEGCRAGAASVIAFGVREPGQAVREWMGTFFHRLPLLHPGTVRVGWGLVEGIAVLDCLSLCNQGDPYTYVFWPPKDAREIPRGFEPELPNPVPGEDQTAWGYPITLQFFGYSEPPALELSLHRGRGRDGPAVECHFSSPLAPLNAELAPAGAFCLIPRQRLEPNSDYTVVARGFPSAEGTVTRSWSFRTGR